MCIISHMKCAPVLFCYNYDIVGSASTCYIHPYPIWLFSRHCVSEVTLFNIIKTDYYRSTANIRTDKTCT